MHINKHNKPNREEIPWPVALPEGSMTECGEDILGPELWAAHWAVLSLYLADGVDPTGNNSLKNNTVLTLQKHPKTLSMLFGGQVTV